MVATPTPMASLKRLVKALYPKTACYMCRCAPLLSLLLLFLLLA